MKLSGSQLAVLKNTIARECNPAEFDLFMEACRAYQLDPFLKQIIPAIYNADNADKRRMTLIVTRDGLRIIAERQGNYRPASSPPEFVTDESAKSATNPQGIISCTVTLHKRDDSGEWWPVVGQVYWDEYVPTGNAYKYSQWPKMPRVMIAKCADVAALRAGWPNAFGGLYIAEEMENVGNEPIDITPSQAVENAQRDQRQKLLGGPGISIDFDGTRIEHVPFGKVFDRISEWLESTDRTPEEIFRFHERHTEQLRQFWGHDSGAALALKEKFDPHLPT